MTETLSALLLRLSEADGPAVLWGRVARPHFGRTFDRLLATGVLVEQSPAESWPPCPDCECGLDERPIQSIGGRLVAACPWDAGADAVLAPDDLRSFVIDPDQLVAALAETSEFAGPVEAILPGVWRLGRMPFGRSIVLALTRRVLEQPGLIMALKSASPGAPLTIVAPKPGSATRMRLLEAGIGLVDLRSALNPSAEGIDALDPAALEPRAGAPRLVIERRARRVILDGRGVHLSEQLFLLLLFLAERALESPATVDVRAIEDQVWGVGIHRIASGIREPIRALRSALGAGAEDAAAARALIENTRNPNGYRLNLAAADISILD